MAQVHVLEYTDGRFRCLIHTATPAGTNGAGMAWSSIFLATGRSGRTAMVEGVGPGQITTAEKAQIMAGTLLEFEVLIDAAPTITSGQLQALLQTQAPDIVTAQVTAWQQATRFYGTTRP